MIEERTAAGLWGLSRQEQEAVDAASRGIVDQYRSSVDAIAMDYAQSFQTLIGLLQVSMHATPCVRSHGVGDA
jgi:hypothetical protein